MTGKLKIVRALANPKRKARKSAKVRRRKGTRQRAVRSLSGKWIVRRIDRTHHATWWGGKKSIGWVRRERAKKYNSANAAASVVAKAKGGWGKDWIVIDVMPA